MGIPIEVEDGELPVAVGVPIQEKGSFRKRKSQDKERHDKERYDKERHNKESHDTKPEKKNLLEITIAERYL